MADAPPAGPWAQYQAAAPPAGGAPGPWAQYAATGPRTPIQMAPDVNPAAIAARTVGKDLWGAAGTAANAVANIPHGVLAGADYFLQKAGGVEHPLPTHALEVTNTTPEMQEFQQAVGQSPLIQNPVSQAVIGKVKQLAAAHPEAAADVTNALNLLPGIGAAREIEGAIGRIGAAGAAKDAAAAAKAAGALAPVAAANEPIAAGRALGFKFRPSDVASRAPGAEIPGQIREGLTGSGELQKDLNKENTALATNHAAQELGLPANTTALREPQFDQAKAPHLATYAKTGEAIGPNIQGSPQVQSELAAALRDQNPRTALSPKVAAQVQRVQNGLSSGTYSGPQLVKDMSWLRKQGRLVPGAKDVAGSLEDEMERILNGAGNPQQLQAFRDARTGLAKIQNVQDATTGGQVDLQDLKRLNEAKPGLLTGRLKVMADAAAAAPGSMRLPTGGVGSSIKAPTIAGVIERYGGKALKMVPGVDVGNDRFQTRAFGAPATPADIAARVGAVGRRVAAPEPPFTLRPSPGATGVMPVQRGFDLPPGLGPRENLELQHAPGALGEAPSRQLGMEMAQGLGPRPNLDLVQAVSGLEPHQPSLLGAEGTPEGGARAAKVKARGKK